MPDHDPGSTVSAPRPALRTERPPDPFARKWLVLATTGLGIYLNVLDTSMLQVSLPVITRELQTNVATVQWVVTGYLLVITGLLLPGGRLADIVGRKRVYLGGMLLFAVAAVFCGLAQTVEQLIAFRVLQGVGSSAVQGVSSAIVVSSFPTNERGRALGIQSTCVALGGITGPVIGGLITDWFGWQWIFFLRIPLSVIVMVMIVVLLRDGGRPGERPAFDLAGAGTLFLALLSLLTALSQGRWWGWGSPAVLGLVAVALVTATMFVRIELRQASPMVPFRIFRNRLFTGAAMSSVFNFMGISASFFLMPFYLQQVLEYPAAQAGTVLLSAAVMMSIFAPISGALSDRFGSRVLSPLGLLFVAVGLYQLSLLDADSTAFDVVSRLALVGIGNGLFGSPNNSALMSAAPRDLIGLASGVMASMRNLGNVIGVAVAGTVLSSQMVVYRAALAAEGVTGVALEKQAFLGGFHDALLIGAGFATLGIVAALVRGPQKVGT